MASWIAGSREASVSVKKPESRVGAFMGKIL
jgi:hypothetical protein